MTQDINTVRILAVDDEEADCQLNQAILESAGYSVTTALTLREARARLAEGGFGVVLVDLRLPDGDGLELLKDARAKDPHIVAVVLTAFRVVDNAVRAVKSGAYDFLGKPCPSEMLVASINRAAEKYLLSRTLDKRNKELEKMNRELDSRVREATREIFALNEKLKRYVSQLVEDRNEQTRFLEEMAHELKNPLSVIWGYSSFLLRRPMSEWTAEDLERSIECVQRNSQHIQSMIEELLDSARIAGQKITIRKERLRAAEAVEDAVQGLRLQAGEHGITLEADFPHGKDFQVLADRNRLHQILMNLVGNATKFTPEGGRITVRAYPEGDRTHFVVQDTGRGLSPEDARRIFDRFYQVQQADQERRGGLGLGLYIVYGLVTLHNGRIWVESEQGKGAQFHFVLPSGPKTRIPTPEEEATTQALGSTPN